MSNSRALKREGFVVGENPSESGWYERLYGESVLTDYWDADTAVWRYASGLPCVMPSRPWRPTKEGVKA